MDGEFDLSALVQRATSAAPNEGARADIAKKVGDVSEKQFTEASGLGKKMETTFETDKEEVKKARDGIPAVPDEKWTKKAPEPDPVQAFGSAASMFAIAASAFTHTPITNALNGAAAAMNALHANDQKAYEDAYNTWKENTKLAMDRHSAMTEDYKAAMDLMKTDASTGSAMLTAMSAKYGDKITAMYNQAGLLGQLDTAWNARNSSMLQIAEAIPKIEKDHDQRMMLMADPDYRAVRATLEKGEQPTAEDANLLRAAIQKAQQASVAKSGGIAGASIADSAARRIAEQYLAGDKSGLQGLGYGNTGAANRAKVQDYISQVADERGMTGSDIAAKIAEFSGLMASERAVGTRTAGMDIAANEVKFMAPLALSASKNVDRTQYPKLNEILLAAEQGTGDENVVRFGLAANSLIYTYSKFLNPTGIPTDADKAKASEILSTAWSKGQFETAIDQIKKEIVSGQSGVKQTKEDLKSGLAGGQKKHAVGETVYQDGQAYTVRKVDANGNVLEAN
jgi:hypothetical protein